jgi:hypothetical protein
MQVPTSKVSKNEFRFFGAVALLVEEVVELVNS